MQACESHLDPSWIKSVALWIIFSETEVLYKCLPGQNMVVLNDITWMFFFSYHRSQEQKLLS